MQGGLMTGESSPQPPLVTALVDPELKAFASTTARRLSKPGQIHDSSLIADRFSSKNMV